MKNKICEKGLHENIDVICNFVGDDEIKWPDIVCKKCFIPERLQNNEEYLKDREESEKYLNKILWR